MEKRNLCGIPVSPLCMGTAAFGYAVPEQTAFRLLDVFCERGGSFVDTANVYCRWEDGTNGSERCIGRYLRLRGKGRLTVATKGGHFAVSDPATSRIRLQELRRDAEESLRTLGLDTIGFYWLHRDDPAIPADEILGMCETLRREGKIAHYGASNWTAERMEQARKAAAENGFTGFFGLSDAFSCAAENPVQTGDPTMKAVDGALLSWLTAHRFPLLPYSSGARGYFQKRATLGKDIVNAKFPQYDNAENDRRFAVLSALSRETGCSLTGCAVAALFALPFPVFPVFSVSDEKQLHELTDAAEYPFGPGAFRALWSGKDGLRGEE